MKIISINANTEHCKNSFIQSLRDTIVDIEKGDIQIGIVGVVDKEGKSSYAEFSADPGPIIFRLVGFLEYLKQVFLERSHG